jgi:alanine dehydrogenase
MRVGVPTEIKEEEYRVALTPAGTKELTSRGHEVLVQQGAGEGSLFSDGAYMAAGARIVPDAEALFAQAEFIVKVKEPLRREYLLLEPRHILFTFLHLAPDRDLTKGLIDSGATCLAYETVETTEGRRPLLTPMSEIAGRLAPQAGAYFLERINGGKGSFWERGLRGPMLHVSPRGWGRTRRS